MAKIPSLAFLVVGVILLVYGLNASNSIASSLSDAVAGAPSNKSIWLMILGVLGIISGGVGLLFRSNQ